VTDTSGNRTEPAKLIKNVRIRSLLFLLKTLDGHVFALLTEAFAKFSSAVAGL